MFRIISAQVAVAAVVLASGTAHATSWELGIRGLGSGMPIEIHNTTTGALVGTYTSHAPGGNGVNFTIDFNGTAGADIQLAPEVTYTFVFKNWSNKAAYVEGHMPPGVPNYDDIYDIGINPDRLTLDTTFGDGVQEMWGFPTATYYIPPPPLTLSLVIYQTIPVGDKTTYKMRGTAAGGTGSYTFAWTQATMTTGPTVNPSLGIRTCLNSQTYTVTCTVNGQVSKSVIIGGDPRWATYAQDVDDTAPANSSSAAPAAWSAVKALYRGGER